MITDFRIELSWEDPQGAQGEELRATWSRLSIVIDGKPVTQVLDSKSESVRDGVYTPAYPLAEWMAFNWWPLLYESGTGDPSSNGAFKKRHNLKFAGEGFALPDLAFVADGVSVHTKWTPHIPEASTAKFLSEGYAVIDQKAFSAEITRFIEVVIARLREMKIEHCPLIEEWEAIRSVDPDEEDFCRAAGGLGLDPFAADDEIRESICAVGENLPGSTIDEFFQAADARNLTRQMNWLLQLIEKLHSSKRNPSFPRLQFGHLLEGEPWRQGYQLALQTRQAMGLTAWNNPLEWGLLEPSQVETLWVVEADPDLRADAVSIFEPDGSARIVVMGSSICARRFIIARSICDYVLDGSGVPLLQTRAGSQKQRRNRAFAAEFLAPWDGIRSLFNRPEADYRDIEMLAEHFIVSYKVIDHQLRNHGIRVLSSW
jgi:hypothetical protein